MIGNRGIVLNLVAKLRLGNTKIAVGYNQAKGNWRVLQSRPSVPIFLIESSLRITADNLKKKLSLCPVNRKGY
jgi:hypothetical protein